MRLSALPTPEDQASWAVVIPCGTTTFKQLSRLPTDPADLLPRLLTVVSSRQRVALPGWGLAVALGRICTFWIASTDFIEDAILDSQQLRV
jgi:hypothetical protein